METNSAGAVLELTDYHPFGTTHFDRTATPDTGNDYKFTGKELDSESSLYYYGARYYNPSLGRFMSEDPAARDIPEKLLTDPQALNFYAYARNNPLRYVDMDGRFAIAIPFLCQAIVEATVIATLMYTKATNSIRPNIFDTPSAEINNEPFTTPASQEKIIIHTGNTSGDQPTLPNMCTIPESNVQPLNFLINPAYQPDARGNIYTSKDDVPGSVRDQIPKSWGEGEISRDGKGWRWTDPQNKQNEIRYSPGNPSSPQPGQQVDNVKVRINGQYRDTNGNIAPKQSQESHIPIDQFTYPK